MITNNYERPYPRGVYSGDRAITVQYYDEANRKRGTAWEASRRILNASNGGVYYSLIRTGLLPVDLKSRVFGYTGEGVIGDMYIMPEGSNLADGLTPDPVQNLNDKYELMQQQGVTGLRDFELYALATAPNLTNAVKFGATLYVEGPTSNQSKGHTPLAVGQGKVLTEQNREYILRIESLSSQNITPHIIMYNGKLDLPVTDGSGT